MHPLPTCQPPAQVERGFRLYQAAASWLAELSLVGLQVGRAGQGCHGSRCCTLPLAARRLPLLCSLPGSMRSMTCAPS